MQYLDVVETLGTVDDSFRCIRVSGPGFNEMDTNRI